MESKNNLEEICSSIQKTQTNTGLVRRMWSSIIKKKKQLIVTGVTIAALLFGYHAFLRVPYINISKNRKFDDRHPTVLSNGNVAWISGNSAILYKIYIKSLEDETPPQELKIPGLGTCSIQPEIAFSLDRKKMYMNFSGGSIDHEYHPRGNIWEIELSTGKTRKIIDGEGKQRLYFISPDGKTITYYWEREISDASGIYTYNLENGETKKIEGTDSYPPSNPYTISPDGKRKVDGPHLIGISKWAVVYGEITVSNIDGSDPVRLTDRGVDAIWLDNNTIVYETERFWRWQSWRSDRRIWRDSEIVMQKVPAFKKNKHSRAYEKK